MQRQTIQFKGAKWFARLKYLELTKENLTTTAHVGGTSGKL